MSIKKKPEIRFKGFTDVWEQRKLYEISDKVTEKNVSRAYSETLTNSAEFGIISQREFFDKDISNEENIDGYYIVQNDDFVYNPRISTFAPVGPIKRNKLGRNGVMSPLYYVFRTHDIDPTYLEYLFTTTSWHKFMKLNGDSGARSDRFSIKDSVFCEMPLPYPSLGEQKKIGELFDTITDFIILHQRKCEKLKNIKKFMLEKMFPKPGSNIPEIRFKGFTETWEQRKVRDIADRFDNLRIPVAANLRVSGTTPYYGANGIQDYVEGFTHEGEFVLVAEDGANDLENYPVKCVKGRIWVNNHAHVLQGKQNIADNQFLAFSINRADIEPLLVGGGRAKLNAETMMDIPLSIPKIEEQRFIGNYISTIDHLITLHQHKCEKLKNIKKAMLEKMFV
ncbi:restriction endonuclease subunit S [Fusobacterium sp. THCT1E2]